MVNKKEEKLIEESLEETASEPEIESNISEEHSMTTVDSRQGALAPQNHVRGVDIEGLESVPTSMIAVPFVRLVQPSSKKLEMDNGKEAQPGSYLFNDTQKAVDELKFVLLRAKHEWRTVDENGNFVGKDYVGRTKQTQRVSILGITTDTNKLFILSLSITSFSAFGKLIAKFKEMGLDKTYRFQLSLSSEKVENDKGKFYVANFKIGDELEPEMLVEMQKKVGEYGLVLDREFVEEES